jgi:MFS family permease
MRLVPLFLAPHASLAEVGLVAAIYPDVRALAQLATGHWSDAFGRGLLIVAGMLLQPAALGLLSLSDSRLGTATASAVPLGLGTAAVYPTLIAAISDAVSPLTRAPVVGVYRFRRDAGCAIGALIAGAAAAALGYSGAITIVAGVTAASGLWVLTDMPYDRCDRELTRQSRGPSFVDAPSPRANPPAAAVS